MRNLLALPARFGGIGIARPTAVRDLQYEKSLATTKPLVDMILKQHVLGRKKWGRSNDDSGRKKARR